MTRPAVILDALRTPRGRGRPVGSSRPGALAGVHPQELVAQLLEAIPRRTDTPPDMVDDVILGCVSQVDEQGSNVARHALLSAEWPEHVPATTLTRACGSGLQAVHYAVATIMSGGADLVVAGGVESMSRVPMGSDGASGERDGAPPRGRGVGDGRNPVLRRRLRQVPQGISADLIATLEGFTRRDVDAFALASQERAQRAIDESRFARSLVPVRHPVHGGVLLDHEEFPRPTTAAGLAGLPASFEAIGASAIDPEDEVVWDAWALAGAPSFDDVALFQVRARHLALRESRRLRDAIPATSRIRHVHTAGNSSGIADGAAAVLLASSTFAHTRGLTPRASVRSMAAIGSDPVLMLTAPTVAAGIALARAGMEARDIDLWEINEAFAVVPMKTMRDLGVDPERVNVNGGAIALGHPLGASGAILLGTALDELERRGLATALVTLCTAGGQGVAAVIERL